MKDLKPEKIIPGTILHTSWGYDMTHNDYCKVLENTGKTLKCVMVGSLLVRSEGYAYGAGEERPDPNNEIGLPFRVRIIHSKKGNYTYLSGSYPFCAGCGSGNTSKKEGHWWIHKGGTNYYNTND